MTEKFINIYQNYVEKKIVFCSVDMNKSAHHISQETAGWLIMHHNLG